MIGEHHWFGANKTKNKGARGEGHPLLFSFKEADDFEVFPEGGGYPKRFLAHAYSLLGVTDRDKVLHLCSGSVNRGITVDIRPETTPTIVADVRHLPFDDYTFPWILIDPPYSQEYAKNLYGTEAAYPPPGTIMREAGRVLKPGGRVGFLHFQVPIAWLKAGRVEEA